VLVGAMNFPGRSVLKEIHRIADDGFDFVDLTLEPPAAWTPNGKEVGSLLSDLGLSAVGHTAYYLPLASPFPELRAVARDLYKRGLDVFADAGVELVNVHPDPRVPLQSPDRVQARNAEVIGELVEDASQRGITIMVENIDRAFTRPGDFQPIFEAVPDAKFHLDIGHANLRLGIGERNRTPALLEAFADRLALGAGVIDWKAAARWLQDAGWDGTVTLEVFSREREHLITSRRLWLRWWSEARR
jgi:sugar phosphate isomerase/epimerase